MSYISFDQLNALVPDGWLTDALNDDTDPDAEQFDGVRDAAELEVNGVVGLRYSVPLSAPVPPFITSATLHIAAEIVFSRRGMADKFPYKDAVAVDRRMLRDIGAGTLPLSPEVTRQAPSVSIISETSKVYSPGGNSSS